MRVPCFRCKKVKNKEVFMVEKYDLLVCPECQTTIQNKKKSPLGRYIDVWKSNAEEIFPTLESNAPPLNPDDLPIFRLYFLYEDCYYTLLTGRYNASIVLMGVLLEALMKERIRLKLGIDFQEPYGPCLIKIKEEKLMETEDIKFLEDFKNRTRNLYQHADDKEILKDIFVPVWPLEFDSFDLKSLEKAIKKVREGELEPILVSAEENPVIRPIVKREIDKKNAMTLFKQVYEFLLKAYDKYFTQENIEKYIDEFGSGFEDIKHYKI